MTTNSANRSSALSLQEQQSLKDLDAQLIINAILTVVAFFTTLSNLGVLLGVYKGGRSFKSHHYKLVSIMSFVSCFEAFYIFIIMGVVRLIDTIFRIPANLSVKDCGLLLFVTEVTAVVGPYTVLTVSIDRLAAVTFPFRYKHMSNTYKIGTLICPWVGGVLDISAKFVLWTDDFIQKNVSVCLTASSRTSEYSMYKNYRGLIVAILTIFFYLVGIIVMKYKVSKNVNSNSDRLRKDLGFKLTAVCGTDAIIYTLTYFLGQIYTTAVVSNVSPESKIVLSPLVGVFNLLATLPRFFINYYINIEFRAAVKNGLNLKKNSIVVPLAFTMSTSGINVRE